MISILTPLYDGDSISWKALQSRAMQTVEHKSVFVSRPLDNYDHGRRSQYVCRNILSQFADGEFAFLMDADKAFITPIDMAIGIEWLRMHLEYDAGSYHTRGGCLSHLCISCVIVRTVYAKRMELIYRHGVPTCTAFQGMAKIGRIEGAEVIDVKRL